MNMAQVKINIKNLVFWDVMPWSLADMYPCFGGTCYYIFKAEEVSSTKLPHYIASHPRRKRISLLP
jgi:hypothetical protein